MKLARLHRRLTVAMALAALGAFISGSGPTLPVLGVGTVLTLGLFRAPPTAVGPWVERITRVAATALFAWAGYVAFATTGDILPPILALLLTLLAGEVLRPLDAGNDLRLYSLSLALLIAATAFYPGLGFAAAFVAYLAFATLALMVGHLRRQAEHFEIAQLRIGRSFLLTTAALSGVIVLASATVFLVFPRLPRGWIGHGRASGGAVMAGFAESVSLGEHGGRIEANPEVVFRVEFPEGRPGDLGSLHWRGASYDRFDGVRWSRTRAGAASDASRALYAARWGGPLRVQRIYGGPEGTRHLFGLHPVLEVEPRSAIRPMIDPSGDLRYRGADAPVYTVRSAAALPPRDALRDAPEGLPPEGSRFLRLPPLDERVRRLADSLTHDQPTRYDQARAVEHWLRSEFRYTLDLPATPRQATLDYFLFERRAGHCEYFATAMAVLLRAAGIPTRNVNGFLGGTWSERGGYLAVTGNDAHSWVEVYFPGIGWVPFDPTPPAGREASRAALGGAHFGRLRLWFDATQFQWHRWVVDYNLEKQIAVFRRVSDAFSGGGPAPDRLSLAALRASLRQAAPWLLLPPALVAGAWALRRRRALPRIEEARLYLALRRLYAAAGWPDVPPSTPIAWVDALRRAGAPGSVHAERLVRLYLRARFAGQPMDEEARVEMRAAFAEARRKLLAARGMHPLSSGTAGERAGVRGLRTEGESAAARPTQEYHGE